MWPLITAIVEANETGLDADPVAVAVRALLEKQEAWEGTATELLQELADYTTENVTKSRAWPKPNKIKQRLRRLAAGLRAIGIKLELDYRRNNQRLIAIQKVAKRAVTTVTTVTEQLKTQVHTLLNGDDASDGSDDTIPNPEKYRHHHKPSSEIKGDDSDGSDYKERPFSSDASKNNIQRLKETFDAVEVKSGKMPF